MRERPCYRIPSHRTSLYRIPTVPHYYRTYSTVFLPFTFPTVPRSTVRRSCVARASVQVAGYGLILFAARERRCALPYHSFYSTPSYRILLYLNIPYPLLLYPYSSYLYRIPYSSTLSYPVVSHPTVLSIPTVSQFYRTPHQLPLVNHLSSTLLHRYWNAVHGRGVWATISLSTSTVPLATVHT